MASDDDKFWFHAKTYGWGWGLPARWQGWVVLVIYLAAVVATVRMLPGQRGLVVMAMLTVLLIVVVAFTGERPARWRWGRRKDD